MEGDLIYVSGEIYEGWCTTFTVPVNQEYILHGAWANRWSGEFILSNIRIIDTDLNPYYLYMTLETALERVNVILNRPILLKAGWKVQFYKGGTSVGDGSRGCYGLLRDA